ncbi:MAG: fatty oxidation complex subunit alpha, partial [bacterium]
QMAPLMENLEKSGRLGRKNGKGFYEYTDDGKRGDVDQTIYGVLSLPQATNPYDSKECIERGVFAMVNECSLALIEDRIVDTAFEVDLAMIMGTGFPPFRGGLLKYADSIGSQYVADQLATYASTRKAPRLKPSTPLTNMAKANRKFYS